jgi:hypothetical protein
MAEHDQPTPTEAEQAWLDACPQGEARSITHRMGDLAVDFTVDRRMQSSADDAAMRAKFEAFLAREMAIGTDIKTAISIARRESTDARH